MPTLKDKQQKILTLNPTSYQAYQGTLKGLGKLGHQGKQGINHDEKHDEKHVEKQVKKYGNLVSVGNNKFVRRKKNNNKKEEGTFPFALNCAKGLTDTLCFFCRTRERKQTLNRGFQLWFRVAERFHNRNAIF